MNEIIKRYHRVAGIAVHDGHVLIHRAEHDDFWALPGGGIEWLESAPEALAREMREELNETVRVGDLRVTIENFFTYENRLYHETGLYFDMQFAPGSPLLDTLRTHRGIEAYFRAETFHLIFQWVSLEKLGEYDLRPAPLLTLLRLPPEQAPRYLLNDDVGLNGRAAFAAKLQTAPGNG